uniref:Glycerol-3-phosphate dehydrogenase [NAD(+)] n=1 Tax=Oryza punctata TaxID=4537 RepID=A0A0E0LAR5_ORYPU
MRGFLRHADSRTPRAFVQLLAAQPPGPSAADQCHAAATKLGFFASNLFANTALLAFYCRSCRLREAQHLFDQMPVRTVVTWNTLIYGHAQSSAPDLAVAAFARMVCAGISPTASSVSSVLVACVRLEDAGTGAMLHSVGLRCGFCASVVVGTALVDMYAKCRHLGAAQQVFGEMEEKNVATFTALVTGFVLSRRPHDAMLLVREMERYGVAPNLMTYSSLLSSFVSMEDIDHGKQVHCAVLKKGLEHDPFVLSAVVTMYSKCGILEDFVKVQMSVSCQDQVSFNSIISGLSCLGRGKEAFQHFLEMRRHGTDMDVFTFASVLKAIGSSSSLLEGRQVHTLILKIGYDSVVDVQNSLISMYARHGAIGESNGVFISMEAPNLVSWNSLISRCAQHGHGKEVVEMFEQMRRLHVQPDHITFLSVLTACSHVGLVDKGLEYFNLMKDEGYLVGARTEHYACMVDLLGRAGYLNEAEYLINGMPIKPGASVYRALLSACQIHGNLEIAIRVSKRLIELNPHDSSVHVQLSNAFAGDGRWGNAAEIREAMSGKGIVKEPSWSHEVRMWVFEEILPTGKKLSESINQANENCKYLPGIKLRANVIADPDLENAVKDANMLVFVTPHQFVEGTCKKLVGKLRPGTEAISLIKGMEAKMEGPCMISKLITDILGINCCIAVEKFSEVTIGYKKDKEVATRWAKLFTTPYFLVEDIEGVELCGTLKNVVAIAAGLVDGLDMGNNTKAAIMRIGLREMSFDELEAEMLHGQKLQGVSTAKEVYEVLTYRGWQELFPLLSTVHEICIGQLPPTSIVEYRIH